MTIEINNSASESSSNSKLLPENEPSPRKRPGDEFPYLWQSKRALEKILNSSIEDRSRAILIYLALTWISSDEESPTFQTSKGLIAHKCGVSKRTVEYGLADLKSAGVISIKETLKPGTKENDKNIYTLRTMCGQG